LVVVLPKDPITGRRREVSATYASKKEAEAACDRVLTAGVAPPLKITQD